MTPIRFGTAHLIPREVHQALLEAREARRTKSLSYVQGLATVTGDDTFTERIGQQAQHQFTEGPFKGMIMYLTGLEALHFENGLSDLHGKSANDLRLSLKAADALRNKRFNEEGEKTISQAILTRGLNLVHVEEALQKIKDHFDK